jgi:hypothetical protein
MVLIRRAELLELVDKLQVVAHWSVIPLVLYLGKRLLTLTSVLARPRLRVLELLYVCGDFYFICMIQSL